ncbi:lysine N(6)-hydroxylase/L-ornithine N(5)-oxygenase family protein [Lentzea jiangxiensis]|uniref:L-lysine N6-monooxygenase MbtG n=1 Tax=Lentzea jiangxiensis TaxID=641025 RepID=A0A1H0M006_9PSEU|nr:SidA/IucD/PvdA family monooxygenase [Lentzea jiangxiensis]SDO73536.1 lysine N6-hydroxylase [Lentzea jiangxiensis]
MGGQGRTHDFVAVGVGPFNLGLACLVEPVREIDGIFLESKDEFEWHGGMLLEGAEIQTPFMGDLVTLADPTSPYSFLNYLKERGRLYSFYIRTSLFPLRAEFNDYCRWAAGKLDSVRFGHRVVSIDHDPDEGVHVVTAVVTATGEVTRVRGRKLVLGTGTTPNVPSAVDGADPGDEVVHTSRYLHAKQELLRKNSITVVGSGQSAAEVYLDLLRNTASDSCQVNWVTRSPRFFPLDYTRLTLEMTSPDYLDYFFSLPQRVKDELVSRHSPLYKGISDSLITEIFDVLYARSVTGPPPGRLLTNSELVAVARDGNDHVLTLRQVEEGREYALRTEALVLGTGYGYHVPDFLAPLRDRIRWDDRGRFVVSRNYSIDSAGGEIFVQNAELHTHGFVAPDLGMAAYRNSCIIRELLGREHYPIERSVTFQEFAAPRGVVGHPERTHR